MSYERKLKLRSVYKTLYLDVELIINDVNLKFRQNVSFLICFPMGYRDFSVKSKVIISLFQTVRLSLSIFTVCKFVLSPIKYH